MFIRKRPLTKEDLCLFLNEQTAKVINNFEARNGRLKSFELNFNFENSVYRLTDISDRSRVYQIIDSIKNPSLQYNILNTAHKMSRLNFGNRL
jgi:hypothetical protein